MKHRHRPFKKKPAFKRKMKRRRSPFRRRRTRRSRVRENGRPRFVPACVDPRSAAIFTWSVGHQPPPHVDGLRLRGPHVPEHARTFVRATCSPVVGWNGLSRSTEVRFLGGRFRSNVLTIENVNVMEVITLMFYLNLVKKI